VFKLTFGTVGGGLGAEFEPIDTPNGSSLESITVAVPEPSAFHLLAFGVLVLVASKVGFDAQLLMPRRALGIINSNQVKNSSQTQR
jgi:hypothetical protein